MSNYHSSFINDDFEDSATNYALSQNYDHDIDYNSVAPGLNSINSHEEDDDEIQPGEMKKKKNKNLNEPVKPISAYAAFFRDTQIPIKGQNPDASFDEISKIVESMWQALGSEHKNIYKKNAELDKKKYLKALAEYRANIMTNDSEDKKSEVPHTISSNKKHLPIATKPAVFTISTNEESPSSKEQEISSLAAINNSSGSPKMEKFNSNSSLQKCIRDGCSSQSVVNPDWEDEYCSNDCAVQHCRNVFNNWVSANKDPPVEEILS